jgi:hypothetical protein
MTESTTSPDLPEASSTQRMTARMVLAQILRAPVILQAYLLCAVISTLLDFSIFYARPLKLVLVPYGNAGITVYMFTLSFAFAAAISSHRKLVYGALFMLCVGIVFGVLDLVRHLLISADTFRVIQTNAYLAFAPQRPILTIVVPFAWVLLLVAPVMRNWMNASAKSDNSRPRQFQFSLVDILCIMSVVALSLALSIALVGVVKRNQQSLAAQSQITSS